MSKQNIILTFLVAVIVVSAIIYFSSNRTNEDVAGLSSTPSLISPKTSETKNPSPSPGNPPVGGSPNASKIPLPTGDGRTTFIDKAVPWHLLLADASCELKGEIRFISANTYDNQDGLFIYSGIDHPARNIKWTKTPDDGSLSIGPNIFSKMPIPDGQALLGVFPLGEPKSKKYELTAKIGYGRLVDENGKFVTAGGNVKIFEKQCQGKTSVVFP